MTTLRVRTHMRVPLNGTHEPFHQLSRLSCLQIIATSRQRKTGLFLLSSLRKCVCPHATTANMVFVTLRVPHTSESCFDHCLQLSQIFIRVCFSSPPSLAHAFSYTSIPYTGISRISVASCHIKDTGWFKAITQKTLIGKTSRRLRDLDPDNFLRCSMGHYATFNGGDFSTFDVFTVFRGSQFFRDKCPKFRPAL